MHNPTSGRNRTGAFIEQLGAGLEEKGFDLRVLATHAPGSRDVPLQAELCEIQQSGGIDTLLIGGGDGTLNDVLNQTAGLGELEQEIGAFGVLPLGTTNVMARELGIPWDAKGLLAMIEAGHTDQIYPRRIVENDQRFLMWVGAGLDASVVGNVNLALKRRVGRAAYVLTGLREVLRFGHSQYRVTVDGETSLAYSLIVSAAQRYAGSFRFGQSASLRAPELEVISFTSRSRAGLVLDLASVATGVGGRGLERRAGRRVTVECVSGPADQVQVDGDPGPSLPITLEAESEPLPFLTP